MSDPRKKILDEMMNRVKRGGEVPLVEPTPPKEEEKGNKLFKTPAPPKGWIKYSALLDIYKVEYVKGAYDPYVLPPYKDSDWDEASRQDIPSKKIIQERIVNWEVDSKIAEALSINAKPIITSPAGAGKTTGVEFYAALMRQPFARMNMNGNIEPDAILGKIQVSPDKGTYWVDGLYPACLKKGYILCEDEWTKAPSFVNMATQWLREEGGCLRLYDKPEDQVVVPDSRARMAYTDNTLGLGDGLDKYAASNIQDISTINRHGYFIYAPYLKEEEEVKLLKKWFGETITEQFSSLLVRFGALVRGGYTEGEITLAWSPRTLKNVATLCLAHSNAWYGVENAYYNALADDSERAAVKLWFEQVFGGV